MKVGDLVRVKKKFGFFAVGIIVGTYYSVFVASPVVYLGHERAQRREKEKK